jgi:hypothetical protein
MIENPVTFADRLGSYLSGRIGGTTQRRGGARQLEPLVIAAFDVIVEIEKETRHLSRPVPHDRQSCALTL